MILEDRSTREIDQGPSTTRTVVLVLLTLTALLVAVYLSLVGMKEAARPLGCGNEGGCDEVLSSHWAHWGPVPVAALGVLLYTAALLALLALSRCRRLPDRRIAWRVLSGLAAVMLGGAAWLTFVQLFVLRSVCFWCMADHAMGVMLAMLILCTAPWGRHRPAGLGLGTGLLSIAMGLAAVVMVFAGQHLAGLAAASRNTWTESGGEGASTTVVDPFSVPLPLDGPTMTAMGSGVPDDLSPSPLTTRRRSVERKRKIALGDGRIKVTLPLPMLGPPDAEHVIIELFDYACPHCRKMHHLIGGVRKHFGDDLAIVTLPVPLNPDCNHNIEEYKPGFGDACTLAELAVAVWLVDRLLFESMHAWLFETEKVPAVEAARKYAEELVGAEALAEALEDRWITSQIRVDVLLHERTSGVNRRQATLPKIIHRRGVATGLPTTTAALVDLLEQVLGFRPPDSDAGP